MPIIALLLALELGIAGLLVNLPGKNPVTSSKVLGKTILLAEDTTPSTETPPTDTTPPADTTPPPAESTPPPAETTPTPSTPDVPPTPTPTETTTPSPETPSSSNDSGSQSTTGSAPVSTESVPASTEGTPSQQNPSESEQPTVTATPPGILTTDENTTNPDLIDTQSVTEAQQEEQQLATTQNTDDKATVLTHFASDKISDIDRFTQAENFSSTSFANARLSDQIDQLSTLNKIAPTGKIQQQLNDVCQQATSIIRVAEEAVPEEIGQELEITRSKCLSP